MTQLSIIIVSFNTKDLVTNCLSSLKKSVKDDSFKNIEIILIDNASSDGTVNLLKEKFPEVKIISNKENRGYTAANNQGIEKASGDWILLLNSDTVVYPNVLGKIIEFARSNPAISVVGCKLLNADDSLQPSAGYLPNLFNIAAWMSFIDDLPILSKFIKAYHINDRSFYDKIHKIGWVSGAFFLFKKEIIKKAGKLDENIFMYGEEIEWCVRIAKAGWEVVYFPYVAIKHLKGASGEGKVAGIVEEFIALKYIFQMHKPSWQMPILRLTLRLGALLRILFFGIIGWNKTKYKLYVKAFQMA